MHKIKVLSVIGTRPEIIKMVPVIKEFEKRSHKFEVTVVVTGQHKELCQPYLDFFNIKPEYNLSIMSKNQSLNQIVTKILSKLPPLMADIQPDIVLVQGDTTTAFAASLAACYDGIKVGHIEAGLRTGNKFNPFPEEINRHIISVIADYHFAPTTKAKENLALEGIPLKNIFVTGNTIIDTLLMTVNDKHEFNHNILDKMDFKNKRIICVTTHRRENFGKPLLNILEALKKIVQIFPDVEIIIPVHYNPNVRNHVIRILGEVDKIHLTEPLSYQSFVQLLNRSYLILTDSGGIQEEAPSLGKPVLVLRETTERPEGIEAGTAILVGTEVKKIINRVSGLLRNELIYKKMAKANNPYGDGKAAAKIVDALESTLSNT